MADKGRLDGKIAWVTGSSRGIGRVVADHLASLGAWVAVHGTSLHSTRAFGEADSLNDVARAIAEANYTEVLPVCGDLTDAAVVLGPSEAPASLPRSSNGSIASTSWSTAPAATSVRRARWRRTAVSRRAMIL